VTAIQRLLLALRILMETGVVAGLAWWGYQTGGTGGTGLLLAVGAPAIGFGIWAAVDFHQAGRYAEPLRLAEELIISGLAAWALLAIGHPIWGGGLLAVSVVYHGSVYAVGERLLRTNAHRIPARERTPGADMTARPESSQATCSRLDTPQEGAS
jgi:Protein of unknown function (DUF2568)